MNWDRIRRRLAALALMALPLMAAAAPIDSPRELPVAIPTGLAWLEDPGAHMGLPDAEAALGRFRPAGERALSFGFSRAAYWLHFSLQSRAATFTTVYLSVPQPTLDEVRLYVIQNGTLLQSQRAGDRLPQAEHAVPGPYAIFPIALTPGARYDIYLRAASRMGVLQLPLQLQSAAQMERLVRIAMLLNGIYIGVFAALLLYNLFIALSLRRLAYVYYVALLPLEYLVFTAVNGFGPWMLYPAWTWPANQGLVLFTTASFLVGVQFARHLLSTQTFPRLDRVLYVSAAPVVLLLLATPLAPTGRVYPLLLSEVLLLPLIGVYTGIVTLRHGHPQARFYLLAQLASSLGTLLFGITTAGLIHVSYVFRQAFLMGATLQAVLLSLALADRIRALQRATRRAEHATREVEEARRHAEYLATTDALTGVYNRRGLLPLVQDAITRSVRSGSSLSLISFDLDRFKRINDDFGHAEGDRVLCQLVQMTRSLVHPQDLLGRLGGEEFLLVVSAPSDQAAHIAERLRAHLAANLHAGNEQRPVTASFGVASLSRRLSTLETLQRGADAALYRAKRHEGNRVEVYSTNGQTTRTRAIMLRMRIGGGEASDAGP